MALKEQLNFLMRTDPAQLLSLIQTEPPQTIALILSRLDAGRASNVLKGLPPEIRVDVAKRIATLDRTNPAIILQIEKVLEKKLRSLKKESSTSAGGVDAMVKMLGKVDRGTEKTIIEQLEKDNPALAEEIKRKLFVFEDIAKLDDRAVQLVLKEVKPGDLALALKGVGGDIKDKIIRNMSQRASAILQEDMGDMGPVRRRDVEKAQAEIVDVIRRVEETGQIIIPRGKGDELVY